MKHLFFLLTLLFCPALYAEEGPLVVLKADADKEQAGKVMEAFHRIPVLIKEGNGQELWAMHTKQVHGFIEWIAKMKEKKGKTPPDPHQKSLEFLRDYKVESIDKVILYKDVAFVETTITYEPGFLANKRKEDSEAPENVGNEGTSNMPGDTYGQDWESDGRGIAAYTFILQDGAWKIHGRHFSAKPRDEQTLDKTAKLLEKHAGVQAVK